MLRRISIVPKHAARTQAFVEPPWRRSSGAAWELLTRSAALIRSLVSRQSLIALLAKRNCWAAAIVRVGAQVRRQPSSIHPVILRMEKLKSSAISSALMLLSFVTLEVKVPSARELKLVLQRFE